MEASALPRQRALVPRSRRLLTALGDDRLLEQVRRGNSAAFEVIYDRHYRGILSFCRHMLGSREEAEDALQQTFASAFTDLQSNDRDIRLKAWLYTIARNRCLSMLRARREQPAELDEQPTAGLSEEVQQRADLRELLGDLRELPPEQREALVLFELGDLSHAEVANVIGVEPVKVKALVFQARSALIENREARAIPCPEIREQLATATGGALRRGPLRRHIKACEGCRAYRDQVRSQRRALAMVLPVVPTAGLKDSVLAAFGASGGAGGAGAATGGAAGTAALGGSGAAGGGGFFSAAGGLGVAKLAVATTIGVGSVAGGGVAVNKAVTDDPPAAEASAKPAAGPAAGTSTEARNGGQGPPSTTPASERAGERSDDRGADRGRKGDKDKKAKKPKRPKEPRPGKGSKEPKATKEPKGNGNGNRGDRGRSDGRSTGRASGPKLGGPRRSGGAPARNPSARPTKPPRGTSSGGSAGGQQQQPKPPRGSSGSSAGERQAEVVKPPKPPKADDGTAVVERLTGPAE